MDPKYRNQEETWSGRDVVPKENAEDPMDRMTDESANTQESSHSKISAQNTQK